MPQTFNPYKLFVGSFIPNALLKYPGLTPSAKLAWARLAQYAGKDGVAHPKIETLAEEVALSERHTRRTLCELEYHGFIKKIKPSGEQRLMHFPDQYVFIWHQIFGKNCTSGPDVDVRSGEAVDGRSNTRESFQENHKTNGVAKPNPKDKSKTPDIPPDLLVNEKEVVEWLEYKRERGESYKPRGLAALWGAIRSIPPQQRAGAIHRSMAANWAGIYAEKNRAERRPGGPPIVADAERNRKILEAQGLIPREDAQ